MSPGLTGFTGIGYSWSGGTIGFTITADSSNRSRFEDCDNDKCKKKYVVDMKVVVKKNLGIIVAYTVVLDTFTKQLDCPCRPK